MAIINPHINFNGNCEEAFLFYQAAFGGSFGNIVRFKDLPSNPDYPLPESELNKIMTITLSIGPNELIGNDVPSFMGTVNEQENRSKISVTADSQEEADRLFAKLSAQGAVELPLEASADGSCFAMFRDKFGIEWIVQYQPSPM